MNHDGRSWKRTAGQSAVLGTSIHLFMYAYAFADRVDRSIDHTLHFGASCAASSAMALPAF